MDIIPTHRGAADGADQVMRAGNACELRGGVLATAVGIKPDPA